ncbi:RIP metalloprotease RseP [Selenomonas sp. TAMA-11512]|uniref:RIP metalloprotease RseP n=1 Tax=Selenomonas sp. TAMA-11512 TaxID=3095337 RepID=UPI00309110CD|nr:RIP metalloprotease RseP [Selenomonas sp. TAMA-11512]
MVITLLSAIFVFGLLVLVHELGHFVTAKLTDMRVDKFAIGFGPKLFSYTRGETEYSVRIVPLGGFNDIAGMDPEANTAGNRGYCEKSVFARMFVILGGSAMNFILPIFLFFGIFFFSGVNTPSTEAVLGTVIEGQPAAEAGLLAGDRILAVDGQPVGSWTDMTDILKSVQNKTIDIQYSRADGAPTTVAVTPIRNEKENRALIGVTASMIVEHPGFFESVELAVSRTVHIVRLMFTMLAEMITGDQSAELAGPLGVAQIAGETAQLGFVPLLNLTALLSLNLAIVNLFPIPALDGGHFMMLVLEAVRGKPLSPKVLNYVQMIGVGILVLLMLYATSSDVGRIWGK